MGYQKKKKPSKAAECAVFWVEEKVSRRFVIKTRGGSGDDSGRSRWSSKLLGRLGNVK